MIIGCTLAALCGFFVLYGRFLKRGQHCFPRPALCLAGRAARAAPAPRAAATPAARRPCDCEPCAALGGVQERSRTGGVCRPSLFAWAPCYYSAGTDFVRLFFERWTMSWITMNRPTCQRQAYYSLLVALPTQGCMPEWRILCFCMHSLSRTLVCCASSVHDLPHAVPVAAN